MTADKKDRNSEAPRGRGRPKAVPDAKQKAEITKAAWDLFMGKGFAQTSMADVASAAHMSLTTIYRLFPGKNDLFAAVVSLHRESMVALPGNYDELPLVDALLQIFRIELDPEAEQIRHSVMQMFITASHHIPDLQPILMQEGPMQAHSLLVAWLEDQKAKGRLTFSSGEITARMLMDITFGAPGLKDGSGPQWPGGNDRPAYLRVCFTMLLDGLRPR